MISKYFALLLFTLSAQPATAQTMSITQPTDVYKLQWEHDGVNTDRYEIRYNPTDPWLPIGAPAPPRSVPMKSLPLGKYVATVQACNKVGCTPAMVPYAFTVTSPRPYGPLPVGWLSKDVGFVGQLGTATYAGNTFTLEAGGQDIWATDDAFRYVYQPVPAGDLVLTAHVDQIQNTGLGWAKGGLMLRADVDKDNAAFVMVNVLGNNKFVELIFRSATDPVAHSIDYTVPAKTVPSWLRLSRQGTTITGEMSVDGTKWTTVGTATIPNLTFVGMAISANTTTALNITKFNAVALSTVSQPKPLVGPQPPTDVKPINPTPLGQP